MECEDGSIKVAGMHTHGDENGGSGLVFNREVMTILEEFVSQSKKNQSHTESQHYGLKK